MQNNNR